GSGPGEPPRGPTWNMKGGENTTMGAVVAQEDHNTTRGGAAVRSPTWHAQFRPVWPQAIDAWWHVGTGLMLDYDDSRSYSRQAYRLLDTDAPIAKGDGPSTPPSRLAWPFEGSYVNYVEADSYPGGSYHADLSLAYRDGFWQGVCSSPDGNAYDWSSTTIHVVMPPLTSPTGGSVGATAKPSLMYACAPWPGGNTTLVNQYPEDTTRNGQAYRARVWWGNATDGTDRATDAWSDAGLGLVLRYQNNEGWIVMGGRVTGTDAPLTPW
ncbi:MAG: hypothetical protein WDA16_14950, partial [Candidatus Thermoplasmatota archaeon]